jgi:membrane protein implicated in regulation of membrane protease activity
MDDLGGKFWLYLVGIALAIGIGGFLLFMLIGAAWYAWGPFMALVVFGALLILVGWIHDRRSQKEYEDTAVS